MLAQTKRVLILNGIDDLDEKCIRDRFKNGFEFGALFHRLGLIDGVMLHKYCNSDTAESVLSNISLVSTNVRVALGVAISKRMLHDVIAAQPGAAVKLLNLIVGLFRAKGKRQETRQSVAMTEPSASKKQNAFIAATLDAGIKINNDVLLMRRFYESQKIGEYEIEEAVRWGHLRDKEAMRRIHQKVLGKNYKERRRLQQEISSYLVQSVQNLMRQRERHELMKELSIRFIRTEFRRRQQQKIAQLSRDEIAEFEKILERELSVMDQSQEKPMIYPSPGTTYSNILEYIEALGQTLPKAESVLTQRRHDGDRSKHVACNETLIRKRQAFELANQTDEDDVDMVQDNDPEVSIIDSSENAEKLQKKLATKQLLQNERLYQHVLFQKEYQRKIREWEAEREPEYQQWMLQLLDQIYWDKQVRIQKDYYYCQTLVVSFVKTAVNVSEYRQGVADGKVSRELMKRWFNQYLNAERLSLAPLSDDAQDQTALPVEPESGPPAALSTYLMGKPLLSLPEEEIEKCFSIAAAGPQVPPPREPQTLVKFVIVGSDVGDLLQAIQLAFTIPVLDYAAFVDRLKTGNEAGTDFDVDWKKSILKALNHPKIPPTLQTLVDITSHLVMRSPSFIVINIPDNVAESFVASDQATVLVHFDGNVASASLKIKSLIIEKEDSMQCHYSPSREPGVIDYDSALHLAEAWERLKSNYRHNVSKALRMEESGVSSIYISLKSSLESFLVRANDNTGFHEIDIEKFDLRESNQRDQLDEQLWAKSCEHRKDLENHVSVQDLLSSIDPSLDSIYKNLLQVELDYSIDVKSWIADYYLACQTEAPNFDNIFIDYRFRTEQYLNNIRTNFKSDLSTSCSIVEDVKKTIVQRRIIADDEWIRSICSDRRGSLSNLLRPSLTHSDLKTRHLQIDTHIAPLRNK